MSLIATIAAEKAAQIADATKQYRAALHAEAAGQPINKAEFVAAITTLAIGPETLERDLAVVKAYAAAQAKLLPPEDDAAMGRAWMAKQSELDQLALKFQREADPLKMEIFQLQQKQRACGIASGNAQAAIADLREKRSDLFAEDDAD